MIGIIDYNAGNITSVERALRNLNIDFLMSKNPQELENCDKLIFPGVGDASYAMQQLAKLGFDKFILSQVKKNIPLLGICLGSQIIFDFSEEGNTKCLGLISGKINHLYSIDKSLEPKGFKVPHMGWNNLEIKKECPILKHIPKNADFYFVHSYVICPDDSDVVTAAADYGIKIPAVIQKNNIFACQFHPEKSGESGLQILKNFCNL
ncbi:MAG: imidazole glycerol phosphate synthase subunit HisH [Treponema sp.]|nr:imidazole glycerol phosphate synthase subunit HisH [Spirochaetales bacterium]MDY6188880.1 imidazole glycerol phosphate synthase subunit HisH [Treponema sp.]